MDTTSYLLSTVGAMAFRFLVGADVGVEYEDSASLETLEAQHAPADLEPWAVRVRPDVTLAWYDSRHEVAIAAEGVFVQPFADTFEVGGQLEAAARLRLGEGVTLRPGVFGRAAPSDDLFLDISAPSRPAAFSEPFHSVSGGGWLELETALSRRARMILRAEAEAWALDLMPDEIRDEHPGQRVEGTVGFGFGLTHTDHLEVQAHTVAERFEPSDGSDAEVRAAVIGEVSYRHDWTRHVSTEVGLGGAALRDRDGDWAGEPIGHAALTVAGGRSVAAFRLEYEHGYEESPVTGGHAIQDRVAASAEVGPAEGFSAGVELSWARAATTTRDQSGAETTTPVHTVGAALDLRYLHEADGFGVGPFVEGRVHTVIAEGNTAAAEELGIDAGELHYGVLAGLRVQWGGVRRGSDESRDSALAGSSLRRDRFDRQSAAERPAPRAAERVTTDDVDDAPAPSPEPAVDEAPEAA